MNEPTLKAAALRAMPYIPTDACQSLLEQLASDEIALLQAPETGLMMMTITDSTDSDFFLGEVLVTTAEIEYRGRRAQGRIMGDEPEKALLLAVIEAMMLSEDPVGMKRILETLAGWTKIADAVIATEARLAASTRVSFDSMTVENTFFGTIG